MKMSLVLRAFCFLNLLVSIRGATRLYFLGIREIEWDYIPTGRNEITGQNFTEDEEAANFLSGGADRIGSVYKKAVYKQYSDSTYSTEVTQPAWLGFLGPLIRAEVGDEIIIHLKNFALRPYSIHPHGVFYKKDSEGALYPDLMSGSAKLDDAVPPGGSHKYTWNVNADHAPTADDPSCLTWAYHSHVDAPRDIASGLIGALLTCKPGILDGVSLTRSDVDKDFLLMFMNVDENLSWYLEENIQRFCSDPGTVDRDDEAFRDSNIMHSINGYMYGNLPGLEMCAGNSISWHLLGMGSETDVHTAFFHGQALTVRHQRTDVVSLFPATFVTAEMVPRNIGKWLLSCNEHLPAGLGALFNVKECFKMSSVNHLTEKVRKYFIAAQQVLWNYGSSRTEKDAGQALEKDHSYSGGGEDRLGGVYWKAKYVEYTDERFYTEKLRTTSEEHLGMLGPVIKAEVGDTILVTFLNRASRAYSIQPHGVIYKKDFEGTRYNDGVSGDGESVEPLQKFTYEWTVPEYAGPTPSDPPCLTRMYFSAVDPIRDTNSGLVGPLLICKAGTLTRGNHQKEVDKEFFLLFTKFDENLSWYLRQSLKHASVNVYDINFEDAGFKESNVMNTINGFSYNTLPGLQMCRGNNVSWQLLGLGSQEDIHAVVFQGNTLQLHGRHRDSLTLLPHTSASALMQPDSIGSFGIICQTSGMKQEYQVFECNKDEAPSLPHYRVQPTYYLAAEEMEWDYSPERVWELEKMNSSAQDSYGHVFVGKEEGLIGSKYQKVVYREYTDGTFTTRRARAAEEEHLGILGPLIRAEVGDIILIVFKNKASRKYSLHAHGAQETNRGNIPAAEPGEIITYRWNIPERSGPGPADSACNAWAYYSMVDPVKDLHSGLIGPLITCRKGTLNAERTRKDVDREFSLLFLIYDENQSWYLENNIKIYNKKEISEINQQNERFRESNKMHAINGKIYGNLHGLAMYEGERVDWYLLGMGQEIDMHTVHFHAESFTYMDGTPHRADVFDLFPATFQTIEMTVSNPGTWLLHCHVTDHIHAGMETTYTVHPKRELVIDTFRIPVADPGQGEISLFGMILSNDEAEHALTGTLVGGIILLLFSLVLVGVLAIVSRNKKRKRNYLVPHSLLLS